MSDDESEGLANAWRLVAIFAHPDDESLACGGTLIRAVAAGARVTVLSVTPGDIGARNPSCILDRASMRAARRVEMAHAAEVLGVHEARVWDHRDGLLPWVDPLALASDLQNLLQELQAEVVITFGADGLYWHPDHVHVHEQVTRAVQHATPSPALYYVTMEPGALEAAVRATRQRHPEAQDTLWGIRPDAFGMRAAPPTLAVDVRDVIARKMAALRCHATQFGPDHPLWLMDEDIARGFLGREWFGLAPSSARRSEMFEGLGRPVSDTALP